MLLAPLLPHLAPGAIPTVFGVSGYSGAGTQAGQKDAEGRPTTVPKVSGESLKGGIRAYALTDHIHEREAGHHLSSLLSSPISVGFIPSVAPWFSGILSIASVPLADTMRASDVRKLYEEKYGREKLVRVKEAGEGVVELADVQNRHGWVVGGVQLHSGGKRAVVTVSRSHWGMSVI
jgi:N-acetyl-gamma-glutamyl-phosphate reductase/acetylglutamate kinase